MSSEHEVERIRQVYAHYDRTPSEQLKRDQSNPGNRFLRDERQRVLEAGLRRHLGERLTQASILDVGCGSGELLGWLETIGVPASNLAGVDLLEDRISTARRRHPAMTFKWLNAEQLPFAPGSFDVIACSTLFSSILDQAMAANVAAAVAGQLRVGGAVLWFDLRYRNPWNHNTVAMTRSRIRQLFPGLELQLRSVSLLPPLARRLGPATPTLYPLLAAVPALRGHYAGLLVRPTI